MQKTLKAAVAAFSGGVLLLGGASSLAYWKDGGLVPGGTVTSGTLQLADFTCAGWQLDGEAVQLAADPPPLIVPGDTLTRACTATVTAEGDHLTAEVSFVAPSMQAGALADELSYTVVFTVDGASTTEVTSASTQVEATVTVDFPYGAEDNDSNGAVDAILDDIAFELTQQPHA